MWVEILTSISSGILAIVMVGSLALLQTLKYYKARFEKAERDYELARLLCESAEADIVDLKKQIQECQLSLNMRKK